MVGRRFRTWANGRAAFQNVGQSEVAIFFENIIKKIRLTNKIHGNQGPIRGRYFIMGQWEGGVSERGPMGGRCFRTWANGRAAIQNDSQSEVGISFLLI